MADEQDNGKFVNTKLDGELLARVEHVMKAWGWSRAKAVDRLLHKAVNLPTEMDMAPNAELDGEGN